MGPSTYDGHLSIFTELGRPFGKCTTRLLKDEEWKAAHLYVLNNCPEVDPYVDIFRREIATNADDDGFHLEFNSKFIEWFRDRVGCTNEFGTTDRRIRDLAIGPSRQVRTWTGFFSKGFKFKTATSLDVNMSVTMNCGVWVKGSSDEGNDDDYYGVLRDIIELTYTADSTVSNPKAVMFKCDWFDIQPGTGFRIHPQFCIVDINRRRKYPKYEPFIFSQQAEQVYFAPYPRRRKDTRADWWAVFKTKARSTFDLDLAFQEDELIEPIDVVQRVEMDDITTQPTEFELVLDIGLQNIPNVDDLQEEEEEEGEDEADEDEEEDELESEEDTSSEDNIEGYTELDEDNDEDENEDRDE